MRGKCIMFQGTGSSVGKSMLCAAVCRILRQDGLRVAPFKAQNMALNSFATAEGLEMGRAQVVQAMAAGIAPSVKMNPVLLKPTSDCKSQVIVNGKPLGVMSAQEYERYKPSLRQCVREAYEALEAENDVIVLEGAGSPAEINLRAGDIVNMAMAEIADAPVVLVGDIDRGGVFASLYGTVALLTEAERARVRGVVINKFRGERKILEPGLEMLREMTGVPVLGVVPWLDVDIEDEDSVTDRFARANGAGEIRVCVVRLKHISNFTDFDRLSQAQGISLSYVTRPQELGGADLVLLPGSKNTIEDLLTLKNSGMADAIVRFARAGGMVMGICGGYQMLAETLRDPEHTESDVAVCAGLGLLPMDVTFHSAKVTLQAKGVLACDRGWLSESNGIAVSGYEIHTGTNDFREGCVPFLTLHRQDGTVVCDGVCNAAGNVLGTYLHGVFDEGGFLHALLEHLRARRGLAGPAEETMTLQALREREFDRLAAAVRESLEMEKLYAILRGEA